MAKSYAMMVVYFTYSLIRQMDGATSFNYSAFLSYLCTFICQRAIHSDNSNPTLRSKLGYSFLTSLEISNKLKIKMNSYWNKMKKLLGVFPTHLKVWLICAHDFHICPTLYGIICDSCWIISISIFLLSICLIISY